MTRFGVAGIDQPVHIEGGYGKRGWHRACESWRRL